MEERSLRTIRDEFARLQREMDVMNEVAPTSRVLGELRDRAERLRCEIEALGGGH